MTKLDGHTVSLRALEPEDLEFLFEAENNTSFWKMSDTQTPFSKYVLKQYLENAHLDIYQAKQFRFIIEEKLNQKAVGMIDLFDFNPQHQRVGVGILIHQLYQNNGFASEALALLIEYCFEILLIHQLYANISVDNHKSIALFKKHAFQEVGIKKEWIKSPDGFKDEILYQLIKK
ncbi:acetyltransferase [Polaribacter pacificus]|uniref:Acetyltransferase n=1 Tax=Polaribacter pacificus TaxID=1775173 RepID=A0A917MEW1_9FLAO|nr:GNAT family protein [Polaribacter pacificus]GGH00370.1 acetyltransferase [Polaribacter pacificus]